MVETIDYYRLVPDLELQFASESAKACWSLICMYNRSLRLLAWPNCLIHLAGLNIPLKANV